VREEGGAGFCGTLAGGLWADPDEIGRV